MRAKGQNTRQQMIKQPIKEDAKQTRTDRTALTEPHTLPGGSGARTGPRGMDGVRIHWHAVADFIEHAMQMEISIL